MCNRKILITVSATIVLMLISGCGSQDKNHATESRAAETAENTGDSAPPLEVAAPAADAEDVGWQYSEERDPISQSVVRRAAAQFRDTSVPTALVELAFSCGGSGLDDVLFEASTFDTTLQEGGSYPGLPFSVQSSAAGSLVARFDFRIDGKSVENEPVTVTEYSNHVKIRWYELRAEMLSRGRSGFHVLDKSKRDEFISHIADPRMAVRIPANVGKIAIEFSLADAPIAQVLTSCGYQNGSTSRTIEEELELVNAREKRNEDREQADAAVRYLKGEVADRRKTILELQQGIEQVRGELTKIPGSTGQFEMLRRREHLEGELHRYEGRINQLQEELRKLNEELPAAIHKVNELSTPQVINDQ